jgi:hypothetical protein
MENGESIIRLESKLWAYGSLLERPPEIGIQSLHSFDHLKKRKKRQ